MKGQKQAQNPNDTQQDESGSGSFIKKPLPTCNALRFLSSMLSKEGAYCAGYAPYAAACSLYYQTDILLMG